MDVRKPRLSRNLLKAGCAVLASELILGGLLFSGAVAASSPTEEEYSAAIDAARAGDFDRSLPVIERKYRDNPSDPQATYNYILVLGWANRQAEAIAIFENLPAGERPGYVDASVARDYRDTRQYDKAITLYRAGRRAFPDDMTFVYGELLTLTDAGRAAEAADEARALILARPADSDLLTTALYAFGATDRYTETLGLAERILALEPQNRDAHRQQAFSLQRLGAFMLAYEFARASPQMFSAAELRRLASDSAAALVRWGSLSSPDPAVRNTDSDRALVELDRQITAFTADGPDARGDVLTSRFNRMVALFDRGRAADVIAEYEALRREGVEVPPYALSVAAGAYQTNRNPDTARRLYEAVLANDPENFQARIGLFYSEVESEDYGSAFRTIDALVAAQPQTVQRQGTERPVSNPAWLRASLTAAMARYYAGDAAEAQTRVEQLLAVAPDDPNLRAALGTLLATRGKVRAADEQFATAQRLNPGDVSIEVSRADLAITRGDRLAGAQTREQLLQRDATNASVLRLDQRLQLLGKPEFVLRFNGNFQSREVPTGGNSLNVEGQIFSAPLAESYRLYATYGYAGAALPEGRVHDHHTAVGVEYLSRDFFADAEITQDFFGKTRTGARGLIAWAPTDEWRFGGTLQIFSAGTPLRALKHNITADSVGVGITYSPSDQQVFNLAGQLLKFSDDNIRITVDANGTQRLFTSPHLIIDVTADLYGSQNSVSGAPYYNPKSDFAASLTATLNQTLYRRYSFVYTQRVGVTLGEYAESGFSSGFAGSLFYEQRLKLSEDWSGGLGLRLRRQPYDGHSEDSLTFYGDIDWRF